MVVNSIYFSVCICVLHAKRNAKVNKTKTKMSKTVEIRVQGYGMELVQGTFTDEEVVILEKKMEADDETLGNVMWDIEEVLPDSYGWYECDDQLHVYGALVDDVTMYIIEGDNEIKIDNVYDLEDEPYNSEVTSEEICNYDGTKNIITTLSTEKGYIFHDTIELKDDETFNISKLRIEIQDIMFDHYENSLITNIYYNDEEIESNSDTSGKGFDSYLEKKTKR
jgi:hypothetical protein